MPETFARIASVALALAFAWAALAKLSDLDQWRAVLRGYGLPDVVKRAATTLVPFAELGLAVVLVFVSPRAGAVIALLLLALFSIAIMRARSLNGDRLPCGCFGGSNARHYGSMLMRNAVLAACAAVVLRSRGLVADLPAMPTSGEFLPAVLTVSGGALVVWIAWHTSRSLRRQGQR